MFSKFYANLYMPNIGSRQTDEKQFFYSLKVYVHYFLQKF